MALFGRKHAAERDAATATDSPSSEGGDTPPSGRGGTAHSPRAPDPGAAPARTDDSPAARIGTSIRLEGTLSGDEDLEIDGRVDGEITLAEHTLTIAEHGRVTATISARHVRILGHVTGDVTASERIEVAASGVVMGDIRAPRLQIQEGAVLNGAVDMRPAESDGVEPKPKRASAPTPAGSAPSKPKQTSSTSAKSTPEPTRKPTPEPTRKPKPRAKAKPTAAPTTDPTPEPESEPTADEPADATSDAKPVGENSASRKVS